MEAIQANIIVEIQVVHLDVKKEINETIGTLKSKVANFRGEINQKLNGIELKEIKIRGDGAEGGRCRGV